MLQVGSKVRIKETAFGSSQELEDVAARGETGEIVLSFEQQFGEQWSDCWEIQIDDGGNIVNVTTEELEELEG